MARKFLTLSFDDGTVFDRRLTEILNRYGLACTFNLNGGLFGESFLLEWDRYRIRHERIPAEEAVRLYRGQEIAGHGMTHADLSLCADEEVLYQTEEERRRLSALCGYPVRGFAYPGGSCYTAETVTLLKEQTGIAYARNIEETHSFALPEDWYQWRPTVFCGSPRLRELADRFLEAEAEEDLLFFLWGHSYEFEAWQCWDAVEAFCAKMSGRSDITYATNLEVKNYVCGGAE